MQFEPLLEKRHSGGGPGGPCGDMYAGVAADAGDPRIGSRCAIWAGSLKYERHSTGGLEVTA